MVKTLSALPFREAVELARRIKDDTSVAPEDRDAHLWRSRVALTSANAITAVDFLALDMVRFIDLCRLAVAADYIEEAQGVGLMLVAARSLQQRYRSFSDMADHFARARAFWAADAKDERAPQRRLAQRIAQLTTSPDSPWRYVSWSMHLPAEGDDLLDARQHG